MRRRRTARRHVGGCGVPPGGFARAPRWVRNRTWGARESAAVAGDPIEGVAEDTSVVRDAGRRARGVTPVAPQSRHGGRRADVGGRRGPVGGSRSRRRGVAAPATGAARGQACRISPMIGPAAARTSLRRPTRRVCSGTSLAPRAHDGRRPDTDVIRRRRSPGRRAQVGACTGPWGGPLGHRRRFPEPGGATSAPPAPIVGADRSNLGATWSTRAADGSGFGSQTSAGGPGGGSLRASAPARGAGEGGSRAPVSGLGGSVGAAGGRFGRPRRGVPSGVVHRSRRCRTLSTPS